MTLLQHLEALRRAMIVIVIAWGLATAAGFAVWSRVLGFLIARGGLGTVYYTAPTGGFVIALKISLYLGFVLASPIVIQQVWGFVAPGLHARERRLVAPLGAATMFFFAVGITFALTLLPLFLRILNGFAPQGLHFLPLVDEYISFVLILALGFGLVFELPVILFALGILGVISSTWLYAHRLYWMVGLGILSSLATPGADPITPLFMFVPLYLFYEGTALILKLMGR